MSVAFRMKLVCLIGIVLGAHAQYINPPGEDPPLHSPRELTVSVSGPYSIDISLLPPSFVETDSSTGSVSLTLKGMEASFSTVADAAVLRLFQEHEYVDLALGAWGMNFNHCYNVGLHQGLSPSGKYFASGGDGTDVNRGPVSFFDMENGRLYSTGLTTLDNSDWISGDCMLVEMIRPSDLDQRNGVADFPWINYSCMAGDGFYVSDIVLLRGDGAWAVLPDDSCYSYRYAGNCSIHDGLLQFEVVASPNVIPSRMGWHTVMDLSNWVDSIGYDNAFPEFRFRVSLDTETAAVSSIQAID